jgi:hypothetical protein
MRPHCIRAVRPMSALGHSRTLTRLRQMSALPPKADMEPAVEVLLWMLKRTSGATPVETC